ncbi:hypothetical protein LSH36_194g00020 [Paralvinella palmiformis]|uniref:VWFA domain-containing protein n=1 Tax=Paralvinella palmiformis TaxID=53620 RepID=A0AAD9N4Y8_9ANNE|nr:hypothetical protein LSH36_194g00020 [Paralvinella palmiformis]
MDMQESSSSGLPSDQHGRHRHTLNQIVTITGDGIKCDTGSFFDMLPEIGRSKNVSQLFGRRSATPSVVVLITDGGSSFYEADREAGLLRKSGTSIVVIGVGSEINQTLLSAIADNSESLFLADDPNKLIADTSLILGKSCSAAESCSGGQINGWSEIGFPLLLDCPRLSNPIVDGNIFKFECYVNYTVPMAKKDDARFLVQFLHDGVPNPKYSTILSVSSETLTIYETDNNEKTEDDNVAQIYAYSSLPILCPDGQIGSCVISLSVTTNGSVAVYQREKRRPEKTNYKIRKCIYKFFEEDWKANESWAYDSSSPLQVAAMMKIVPVKIRHSNIIMKTRAKKKILSTKLDQVAAGTKYSPWNDYQLTPIQVQVIGGKKRGKCSSIGDPHITTFDGSRIDVYERGSSGIYYLFKSHTFNLKIQTYIEGLYNKQVAVNDGNEITVVTLTEIFQSGNRTKVTSDGSSKILVHTYSGVLITITRHSNALLEVFVDVPSQFWKETGGLCATYDGDKKNDFSLPGVTDFVKRYRIDSEDDSYFNFPQNNEVLREFCQCENNGDRVDKPTSDTRVCGLDDRSLDHSMPSYPVTTLLPRFVITNSRQRPRTKRDVDDGIYRDDIVDYEPPTVSDTYTPDTGPPVWGTHGITEAEAREQCTGALSKFPSYSVCRSKIQDGELENIILNCMTDIQITGDVPLSLNTLSVFQDVCRVNIINDAADYVADPEDPFSDPTFKTLFTSFLDTSCPANCSGNGVCKQAVCQCNPGYLGVDCSLRKGTAPSSVQYLEQLFCDKAERPCRSMRLQADNIVMLNDVSCKMMIKFYNSSQDTVIKEGTVQSPGRLSCKLPDNLPTFFTYRVAIKIDKEDEKRGLTTTFHALLINEFATLEDKIKDINLLLLNKYTTRKPTELCEALNLRSRQNVNGVRDQVFHSKDIKIADGFPEEINQEASRIKWLVEVSPANVKSICVVKAGQADKQDVNGNFLQKALTGLGDEVSKLTSKNVKVDYKVPEVESQKKPNPKRSTAAMIPVISTLITGSVITTFIVAFRIVEFPT